MSSLVIKKKVYLGYVGSFGVICGLQGTSSVGLSKVTREKPRPLPF